MWLSGFERWRANQEVTGSIPGRGTCLGCGPVPQWGVATHWCFSYFLPSPLKIHKIFKNNKIKFVFKYNLDVLKSSQITNKIMKNLNFPLYFFMTCNCSGFAHSVLGMHPLTWKNEMATANLGISWLDFCPQSTNEDPIVSPKHLIDKWL